jgi:imidazolonepropionase-like amidohydrolase
MSLMRPLAALICLSVISVCHAVGDTESTTPPLGLRHNNPRLTAFTGADVVVAPGRLLEDAMLVIRDGRVVAVALDAAIPEGATVIDLTGKRVYPGFIDPYTEYGLNRVGPLNPEKEELAPKYAGTRVGANAWNDAIHAEREWVAQFVPDADEAKAYLARGVTSVQSVKQDGIFRGMGFVTSLAQGLPNDVVLVPHSLQFAAFDKGSSQQSYPSSLMGSIAIVRQTLLDANWYRWAHAAYARGEGDERPEFNRAIEALAVNEAPIVFETNDELSLLRAARALRELSVQSIHVGSNLEYARIEQIAALDQPIILPVAYPAAPPVTTEDAAADVTLADLRHWERAPYNPSVLDAHGVRFAFTGHGLEGEKADFLGNVRRAVRRGLPPDAALAALTTVPAQLCGIADQAGTLEPGRRADFFIASGDVLTEPAEIFSVWIDGELAEEFLPVDQSDFRGSYRLKFDGREHRLKIRGKLAKLKGELKRGEDSAKLEGIETGRHGLTFHASLSELGTHGTVRFELKERDGALTAEVWMPGGTRTAASLRRDEDEKPEPEDEDEERLRLVSSLTRPNVAFGYAAPAEQESVLIRGATIWTAGPDGVLSESDLLVQDGRITRVGSSLDPPEGAQVIDARGKHVTPGIIDEHAHIAIARGVNEGTSAVSAEVRIGDVLDSDDISIYRALAGGVTTAQLLHGSANPIGGQAQVIKLRWGAPPEEMKFAAAPPSIKFALGENVKQSNWGDHQKTRYPQSRMGVESIMRDAFTAAEEYARAWDDYAGAPERRVIPPRRDLRLDALLEILRGERFVHCHSYMQAEILMLMRLAEEFGFTIQTFTHILEGYKVAGEMAEHGTTASSFSDWWAYKFEVYDAIPYNTCLLIDRGVVTSVNSDSREVMRRLNTEAAKSVMYCGTEPEKAIKLVTLNPAIQLRIDDRVGSLEPGKDADFVIWNGDPLSIYSKVEATWVDGARQFDLETDAMLREANLKERRALIQKVLDSPAESDKKNTEPNGHSAIKAEPAWNCEDVEDVWRRQ